MHGTHLVGLGVLRSPADPFCEERARYLRAALLHFHHLLDRGVRVWIGFTRGGRVLTA